MPVTVIPATPLAARLKEILAIFDQAAKLAEGGYSQTHTANRLGRQMLHDLVAEVSE